MVRYSVGEAIEKSLKEFLKYSMSLLAAMVLNEAVSHSVEKYKTSLARRWLVSLTIIFIAMALITVVTVIDPSDIPIDDE